MADSKVSLCNATLTKIGSPTIMSLTDNNERASVLNERYNDVLKQVLRSHPWNFAIGRQVLARLTATPPFEFKYYYQLPTDCLRVLLINPESEVSASYIYGYGQLTDLPISSKPNYKLEGRRIATNDEAVNLLYVKFEEDPTLYSPTFEDAFTSKLAAEVVVRIKQDKEMRKELLSEYISFLRIAKSQDGSEDTPLPLYSDDFVAFSRR